MTTSPYTAVNCSIDRAEWRAAVRAHDRVELWWPWNSPTPTRAQLDEFVNVLAGRDLVALNAWAGDMAAGERGVFHRQDWEESWVDVLEEIHHRTGVRRFNVLLGRGGRQLGEVQRERFLSFAAALRQRFGGVAMVEPLSGMDDYPVCSVEEALGVVRRGAGLLLDVYHTAANGFTWPQVRDQLGGALPEHVQFADWPGRGRPGTGTLDFGQIVGDLQHMGYAGELVLEHVHNLD